MHEQTKARTTPRRRIGTVLQKLRSARGWSQGDLARRVGLSQARLSRIEHGLASLTAEEFLAVLELFNVGPGEFVTSTDDAQSLQNALGRFGATHLRQVPGVAVHPSHQTPLEAVRAVLLKPSSERLVTALAPVLLVSADEVPLPALQHDLLRAGVPTRLPWVVENTTTSIALQGELEDATWRRRSRRAGVLLQAFLDQVPPPNPNDAPIDPFDPGIRSAKTLEQRWQEGSAISKKWRIASAIRVDDFADALRGAIGPR